MTRTRMGLMVVSVAVVLGLGAGGCYSGYAIRKSDLRALDGARVGDELALSSGTVRVTASTRLAAADTPFRAPLAGARYDALEDRLVVVDAVGPIEIEHASTRALEVESIDAGKTATDTVLWLGAGVVTAIVGFAAAYAIGMAGATL